MRRGCLLFCRDGRCADFACNPSAFAYNKVAVVVPALNGTLYSLWETAVLIFPGGGLRHQKTRCIRDAGTTVEELHMRNDKKLQKWIRLALLVALELVMRAVGLGAVPVGPLNMSFLTLPIAVGAMLLGPVEGMIMGGVFGLLSLSDAITGRSKMTAAFFMASPANTVVLCVLMRMLMGLCCGYVFRLCSKVESRYSREGKLTWSYFVGAVSAPLLNTLLFMGYIVLVFYPTDFVQGLVTKLGAANPLMFVVLLVGIQGLVEAGVCGILGGILTKAVNAVLSKT